MARKRIAEVLKVCSAGFAFFVLVSVTGAGQSPSLSDAPEEATEALSAFIVPGNNTPPTISRRQDLEVLFASFDKTNTDARVFFFESRVRPVEAYMAPVSIIAITYRAGKPVKLFDFKPADAPLDLLIRFNNLTSSASLSVPQSGVIIFAKLFFTLCFLGTPERVVLDQDSIRLEVQNYYWDVYADLWRMLDAYTSWWESFQRPKPSIEPEVIPEQGGAYRVSLTTLVTMIGRHPEIHRFGITVSSDGRVRIASIQMVFPAETRWLFYDFSLFRPPPTLSASPRNDFDVMSTR